MICLYIIQSHNGAYYVGVSRNVKLRLHQHNSGRVKSTKAFQPWVLRYTEEYSTLAEAQKREAQIKNWKSRKSIERLMEM